MSENEQKPEIKIETSNSALNFLRKFTDERTIMGSVCKNVIIPRLVDTAYEGSVAALKKFFWGEDTKWSRGGGSQKSGSIVINGHTPYNTISSSSSARNDTPTRSETPLTNVIDGGARRKANVYSIRILDGNGIDAWRKAESIEEVLMEKYRQAGGLVSVQDLYLACGESNIPSTALNYGWDDLSGLKRYRDLEDDRYVVIQLPKPKDIRML